MEQLKYKYIPSEYLYLFGGWLTTRKEVSGPFSEKHNAAGMAELINEFCKQYDLPDPREDWNKI